jgi:large subunit ribosomal protein LP0
MKSLNDYIESGKMAKHHSRDGLAQLNEKISNIQVLIIFTNEDLSKVTEITSKFIIEKQAKTGAISPIEVTLPSGPTGMDASQIEYFQALNIQTKVIKNQLEIINATKILTIGQKITLSEINLMKKFNIKPYKHLVQILHIYLNGKLYDNGILKINDAYLKKRVEEGIRNLTAFSLGANIPTKASAPHIIGNAFRNIIGLSLATNVVIPQAKNFTVSSSAPAKEEPKKEEPKKEEKKKQKEPEPEPEEEAFGLDLFG